MNFNNIIEPKALVDLMESSILEILNERKKEKIIVESKENIKELLFTETEVKTIISEAFTEDLQKKILDLLFSKKVLDTMTNKIINYIIKNLDVKVNSIDVSLSKLSK